MGVVAALGAALSWTLASSIWRTLSTSLSAIQLNALKNGLATLLLLPVLLALPWRDQSASIALLLLSGVVGISLGDSFYLAALRRLGTRRTLTVEALAPLLASVGGLWLMGEPVSGSAWLGAAMVTAAVVLVASQAGGSPGGGLPASPRSRLWGLACSLMAVVCGLIGAGLSRAVLAGGDLAPLQTSAIRLLGGLVLLLPWCGSALRRGRRAGAGQRRWLQVGLATFLGTNLGILLQQVVFQQLAVGPGVTLLSTAPVMALAVAHREGDAPRREGVLASLLSVTGVALALR
ncbi:EamA family transporter [Synechococcus sp. RSCCF101]|nr:EamA family transporter [Synechococcus sp. RSCCF101]